MGLTSHGLRDIGDVTAIALSPSVAASPLHIGKPVAKDAPLLCLDWEGYGISSADELYHTTWENIDGVYEVTSPVSGVLEDVRVLDSSRESIDETDVLAVVVSKREEVEQVVRGWVEEEEYRKILDENKLEGAGERLKAKRKFTTVEGGWSG